MRGLPARLAGDLLEAADFLRAFGEPLGLGLGLEVGLGFRDRV